MNAFRMTLAMTLLTAIGTAAQAAPHWSADIGTGRAAAGVASAAALNGVSAPVVMHASAPHWTALVGSGRAAADSIRRSGEPRTLASATGPAPRLTTHWTAKIGTGRAAAGPT
jgi:hypothetical protein